MEQITSKDGTVIGFKRSGSGPPLLLVHGTTADHRRWSAISPAFEQYFTVYAMDRRGRGASSDGPNYHVQREAEDVAAVVESIGGPVFLLGHSYGAVCSLEASLLTDRVSRLILYEPPLPTGLPLYPDGFPDRIQAMVDKGESEAALESFFSEIVRMPASNLLQLRQHPMWAGRIPLAPTIARELVLDRTYRFEPARFARFQSPALILLGGDSPPVFRQAIQAVAAALTNSRVVVLPGQQHVAMDTNPDLFISEVLEFLGVQQQG